MMDAVKFTGGEDQEELERPEEREQDAVRRKTGEVGRMGRRPMKEVRDVRIVLDWSSRPMLCNYMAEHQATGLLPKAGPGLQCPTRTPAEDGSEVRPGGTWGPTTVPARPHEAAAGLHRAIGKEDQLAGGQGPQHQGSS